MSIYYLSLHLHIIYSSISKSSVSQPVCLSLSSNGCLYLCLHDLYSFSLSVPWYGKMCSLYPAPEETKACECFFPERLGQRASLNMTVTHDTCRSSHFQLPASEFFQPLLMFTMTEELPLSSFISMPLFPFPSLNEERHNYNFFHS